MGACRHVGAATVAVHSDADASAAHVADADEAVLIGPAPARESYLNIEAIIHAARRTQAEAIHPGYGFLSENWRFAEACASADITFIGPPAEAIRRMGDKPEARRLMAAAGVPVLPGSPGPVSDVAEATRLAERVGFPVLLKAAAGGGDRKSTRLNSSHRCISYAVFCLKKKICKNSYLFATMIMTSGSCPF